MGGKTVTQGKTLLTRDIAISSDDGGLLRWKIDRPFIAINLSIPNIANKITIAESLEIP